jgi:hypothetical protein
VTERILLGHFLTRREAARRAAIPRRELMRRPDLLRIGGTWLEEVYFEFQFDGHGIRPELGRIVRLLRGQFDDFAIADWLVRPNEHLAGYTPLRWVAIEGDPYDLEDAALKYGPVADPVAVSQSPATETSLKAAA